MAHKIRLLQEDPANETFSSFTQLKHIHHQRVVGIHDFFYLEYTFCPTCHREVIHVDEGRYVCTRCRCIYARRELRPVLLCEKQGRILETPF